MIADGSCVPEANTVFMERRAELRALQPIQVGKEVIGDLFNAPHFGEPNKREMLAYARTRKSVKKWKHLNLLLLHF